MWSACYGHQDKTMDSRQLMSRLEYFVQLLTKTPPVSLPICFGEKYFNYEGEFIFPCSVTCLMNSSSFSTNDSRASATSVLNLHKNERISIHCRYFPRNLQRCEFFLTHQSYLSLSSSVKMNLSLNLGSALFSHQNLWVFFLCSGLKPNTNWMSD